MVTIQINLTHLTIKVKHKTQQCSSKVRMYNTSQKKHIRTARSLKVCGLPTIFIRGRLSKSKTKKAQTAWAAKDRVSEQYSWKPGPAAALLVTFGEAARLRSDPWRTYQGLALPALGK